MGRRKTRKVIKREPKRLPKVFRCPRCGEQSVVVDLDRQLNRGRIKCGRCQLSAELPIHTLTQTIDVYARFLDMYYEGRIEETPREAAEKPAESSQDTPPQETQQSTPAAGISQTEVPEAPQPASDAPQAQPKPTPQTGTSQQTT